MATKTEKYLWARSAANGVGTGAAKKETRK